MIKQAGIVSCSNGQLPERKNEIDELFRMLSEAGICPVEAAHLYARDGVFSGTARERAEDLMAFYQDERIDAIFDISGGDIANEILDFLDYDIIRASEKEFWGYSDLTTVINAIYTMTGKSSVLYQVKNLVWDKSGIQKKRLEGFQKADETELFDIRYHFLQGKEMSGIVAGGNVRCFLKLAGTRYWPELNGKILLLEALGGEIPQISTYFAQLSQLGAFEKVSGILLGTFTRIEQSGTDRTVYDLIAPYIPSGLPVAKTAEIGHGNDAKAIRIGETCHFK